MTARRVKTTWVCAHCPQRVEIFIRVPEPPIHACTKRSGRVYALEVLSEPEDG